MKIRVAGVAVTAIAAMLLGACGSSGGSASTPASGSSASPSASQGSVSENPSSEGTTNEGSATEGSESTGSAEGSGSGDALTDESFTIGLDLPEHTSPRYENKDRPYFEAALKKFCPNCKMLYSNAHQSASKQMKQAQSMLSQGADALVIDPFDGEAAASIVAAAQKDGVPTVAYDRLIHSDDLAYVISNDYTKVGQLQAQSLVDALKAQGTPTDSGGILVMNGSATDNNALNMKAGSQPILKDSGYKTLAMHATWDPKKANTWFTGQIAKYGHDIIGIYTANDTNAGVAIAALKADGWTDDEIHDLNLTGLDASIEGLQNIIAGLQHMTTYNAFKSEATNAAKVAVQLAMGQEPDSNGTVDGHPAFLNPPQAVTIDNMKSTVIADGFQKVSDLCTDEYEQQCKDAGLE